MTVQPYDETWAAIAQGWLASLISNAGAPQFPRNASSPGYEAFRVVKSGPGTLFGLSGYSSLAGAAFIQVHDFEGIPPDGATPVIEIALTAASNFSMSYVLPGRAFLRGIFICTSSTSPTKTIGAANCFFDVQFF